MSELKARKFFEVVPTSKAGFYQPGAFVDGYLKTEADKVIAKKDAAITELEQKLEDVNEIIKTARQMLEDAKATLYTENERLKEGKNDYKQFYQDTFKELESLKASHYAEMVDAGMRERKLRRALWIARSKRAEARKNYWYVRSIHEGDKNLWSIDGSAVKYIGCIKRKNFDWLKVWSEVEIKCRTKAEQYK